MNMEEMIKSFPRQLEEQYNTLQNLNFNLDEFLNIDQIVVCGMGGSAISGDIAKLIIGDNIEKSIQVIRDYDCSKVYKNNSTLFIISSYSGNTEETLSMYNIAKTCSKKIICVTTGGELKKIADNDNIPVVLIPTDFQPRAALGYSLMSLIVIFNKLNFISKSIIDSVLESIPDLHSFYSDFCKEGQNAYKIAESIYSGFIYIYGTSLTDPIASRFRAQISENAKLLASHSILPELNHNEIEGFGTNPFPNISRNVLWMIDKNDHEQVQKRMRITSEIFKNMGINNFDISISNNNSGSFISRSLELVYLTDWISYYLAKFNQVDPIPVNTIMKLKDKMS
tara:strand:- start:1220 stop:2236 length:1017 start_codon:yes stop_codon:yes gene_type:complete